MSEASDTAKLLKTKARRTFPIGKSVIEVSPFKPVVFFHRAKELKFQKALFGAMLESNDVDGAIFKACCEINEGVEWADKYFRSPRYKAWLADRMEEIEANAGLTVGYIAKKHKDNIDGTVKLTSSQLSSLEQLGERIWPKVTKVEARVEAVVPQAMDDLMKAKSEVDALEVKLREALKGQAA